MSYKTSDVVPTQQENIIFNTETDIIFLFHKRTLINVSCIRVWDFNEKKFAHNNPIKIVCELRCLINLSDRDCDRDIFYYYKFTTIIIFILLFNFFNI